MRKTIIIALLIQLCCLSSKAQVNKEHLEQAKNYLGNKLTYLRMEILAEENASQNKSIEKFEKVRPNLEGINVTSAYGKQELKGLIASDFSGIWSKLSEPIFEINVGTLSDKSSKEAAAILSEQAFKKFEEKYPIEYEKVVSQKAAIQANIEAFFNGNITAVQPASTQNNVPQQVIVAGQELETSEVEPDFFDLSHFSFWTLLPLILTIACAIFLLNKFSDIESSLKKIKDNYWSGHNSEFSQMKNSSSDVKMQVDNYISTNPRINELSKKVEELLQHSKKEQTSLPVPPVERPVQLPKPEPVPASATEVFYMSQPTNNYFPSSARSNAKDNTLYKFYVKPNQREAEFEVHTNGVPISDVLPVASRYIEPACIPENLPSRGTRSIKTITKGRVVLEGDKWVIQSKATIKYE